MAKVQLTDAVLKAAIAAHCESTGKEFSEGEHAGLKAFILMPGDILAYQEAGKLICPDQATYEALCMIIAMDDTGPAKPHQIEDRPPKGMNVLARTKPGAGLAMPSRAIRDVQVSDLTAQDIKEYLCPKATDQEAFMFLKLCQARGMNPFLKEAYLIKYSDSNPATMVVGKEHFTMTAEKNPMFDGFEAGIILKTLDGITERREGTFMLDGEVLLGGYAKVWRKDRSKPFVSEVSLKDFIKTTPSRKSPWDTMPAVMIRKVPLVQSLREAFPNDFSGCYDSSEMGIDPSKEVSGQ